MATKKLDWTDEEKTLALLLISDTVDEALALKMVRHGYSLDVLAVVAPEELMARYGLSREEAQKIIDDAMPKSVKIKRIQEAND